MMEKSVINTPILPAPAKAIFEYVEERSRGKTIDWQACLHSIIMVHDNEFHAAMIAIKIGAKSKPPREIPYGRARTPTPMQSFKYPKERLS